MTAKSKVKTQIQYLTFAVGEENYGIELMKNKEIIKPKSITRVPHTDDYVLGVINLRGQIVPVIDLGKKLELATIDLENDNNRIIIVQIDGNLVGMMVDSVNDIVDINPENIENIRDNKSEISQEFIKGVFSVGEILIIVIDINKILYGVV